MATNITITAGDVKLNAQLNDSPTAVAIAATLPINGNGQRWGKEIYFKIPITAELESDARDVLNPGELGYWPTGNAFCIFWGPTPASHTDEIRAASPVNIIGTVNGDLSLLDNVKSNTPIIIDTIKNNR
ncbi:MAG: hypothetical protein IID32_09945 [Planctomycetes bacterium]|nr:hypothetical protein [Planctomycetota bacterium]